MNKDREYNWMFASCVQSGLNHIRPEEGIHVDLYRQMSHKCEILIRPGKNTGMAYTSAGTWPRFKETNAYERTDRCLAMIEDGLFEKFPVDSVYGMHNWPGMAVGKFGVRPGSMMASFDTFDIEITGIGAHAAMPHSARRRTP